MGRYLALALLLGLGLAQYSDVRPDQLEWQAIQALTEMGVVFGYPDGTFRPKQAITRGEVVLSLYRLWQKAKDENNTALADLAKRLTESIVALSQAQAKLEERLQNLEAVAQAALKPEDREAILAEVAALRSTVNTIQESLSLLTTQYESLLAEQARVKEALAAVDQRSLAWAEDSVNLQARVGKLEASLKDALQAFDQKAASLEAALNQALRDQDTRFRQTLSQAQSEASEAIAQVRKQVQALEPRVAQLEERITATREELFRLAEELKRTKEELTRRLDQLSYAPPPLQVAATLSGFNPLVLSAFLAHDSLLGVGLRLGGDYHGGTGEFQASGALYVPFYRQPARGAVGFGLAYSLTGPYAGLAEVMGFTGLGLEVMGGLEAYGEARYLFPLDGSTPRARVGFGVKVRF